MDASTVVNLGSLLFSLLAVAVSAAFALRQSKLMRDTNLVPVVIDLFQDFRDPEFKAHLSYIQHKLWDDCPPADHGMTDLPNEARGHAYAVLKFFDTVGLLVAHGVVNELVPLGAMGGSILRAWARIGPYLKNERIRRQDPNYAMFFENLAARAYRMPPARLNARLRLRSMPENWSFSGWEDEAPEVVAARFAPRPEQTGQGLPGEAVR
jgi:hypothetical protein